MLMFPSIVAILFFLNCQKQDYILLYAKMQAFLFYKKSNFTSILQHSPVWNNKHLIHRFPDLLWPHVQ